LALATATVCKNPHDFRVSQGHVGCTAVDTPAPR
jgi:hypothetical protein